MRKTFEHRQNGAAIAFYNSRVHLIDVGKLRKITRFFAIYCEGLDGVAYDPFRERVNSDFGFSNNTVKIKFSLLDTDIETACNRDNGFKLNQCAGDFAFDRRVASATSEAIGHLEKSEVRHCIN